MTDDIVKRLRTFGKSDPADDVLSAMDLNVKAADEIERLRADVEWLTRERDDLSDEMKLRRDEFALYRQDAERKVERLTQEREQIFDDCAKRNAEHEASERKVEKLREALLDTTTSLTAAHSLLRQGGKKSAPSDKMFEQMLLDYEASADRARTTLAETEKPDGG